MSNIENVNTLQRPVIGDNQLKANRKAAVSPLLGGLNSQTGPSAGAKKDRVSISAEGRKAAAAFQAKPEKSRKQGPGALKSQEEEKDAKSPAAPASPEKEKAEGAPGPGGAGGEGQDSARQSLEQKLEALQKEASELKKEIDKLRAKAGQDEEAAAEMKSKEAEEQMIQAQISMLSQQLSNLDSAKE